jgi:electron transport complex protein RnfD
MATDYVTTPLTPAGKIIFGLGAGIITVLIRSFGNYPEGVMFSILIMNMVTPFLNRIIPKKYGYVPPIKAGGAK